MQACKAGFCCGACNLVRMCVDYLVLVVSAVSVYAIGMHDVRGSTCMHAVCGGHVCMMCVGDLYA